MVHQDLVDPPQFVHCRNVNLTRPGVESHCSGGLGMVDQGVNAGEDTGRVAVSTEPIEGGFARSNFVTETHADWSRSILNVNDRIPLEIGGDRFDQDETAEAGPAVDDEDGKGGGQMRLSAMNASYASME